ncbi:hypothetical protein NUACC21_05850 [Scytonema sp. NUACC21]
MSSTDPFKDYKTKHLVLLIGENPLPNYVAAMKLLEEKSKVYLVHTNQTIAQKNRLMKALKKKGFSSQEVPLDNDHTDDNKSNAYKIYNIVQQYLKDIPLRERIGLHYTGGTNTMAVHTYRAISDLKRSDTVYSYLDARTLEIFIDTSESEPFHRGVQLEVSLKDLFNLHNYEFKLAPRSQPILPDVAAELVRIYQDKNEQVAQTWRKWSNTHQYNNYGELKKAKDLETGYWKSEEDLSNISLNLSALHPECINVLVNKLEASRNLNQLSLRITKQKGFDSCKQVCEWLGGIWLEHYVLSEVQEIAKNKNLQIGESQMSFLMKINKDKIYREVNFEFDVAFMRHYQLFAISCTTSKDPKECKLKLFEAYTRAKQLGGDEARVALVCCCDNDETKDITLDIYLKSQLEGAVNNPKIAVFLRKDLQNIRIGIADWIERNKGKS